jgi:hypothetical protein
LDDRGERTQRLVNNATPGTRGASHPSTRRAPDSFLLGTARMLSRALRPSVGLPALAFVVWAASARGDPASYNGTLGSAEALPEPGVLRVSNGAWADKSTPATISTGAGWSPGAGLAVQMSAESAGAEAYPSLHVGYQWLRQREAGVNATASLGYRSLASEGTAAVVARLALSRSVGPVLVGCSAAVDHGVLAREDVDGEAAATAMVGVARDVRLGGEARVRTELVDTFKTIDDIGRPLELVGGAAGSVRHGDVVVHVFAGWDSPRGLLAPGPIAVVATTWDF